MSKELNILCVAYIFFFKVLLAFTRGKCRSFSTDENESATSTWSCQQGRQQSPCIFLQGAAVEGLTCPEVVFGVYISLAQAKVLEHVDFFDVALPEHTFCLFSGSSQLVKHELKNDCRILVC